MALHGLRLPGKSGIDRFNSLIKKTPRCWLWRGHAGGMICINYKHYRAARLSYAIYMGRIGSGKRVLQKCSTYNCVRPDHLYLSKSTVPDNFMKNFEKKAGKCWEWAGYKNGGGYGMIGINGKYIVAHRRSWEVFRGPIPQGLFVLHKCDNPPCVNPKHLWLGTQKENIVDMYKKGRAPSQNLQKTRCKRGHLFTVKNTRVELYRGKRSRRCVVCVSKREKERYRKRCLHIGAGA